MRAFMYPTVALTLVALMASVALYASALDPCPPGTEDRCPAGPDTCPNGDACSWGPIGPAWDQSRTLCSCYTPGCGSGPCNHHLKWTGQMAMYGCWAYNPNTKQWYTCKQKTSACWTQVSDTPVDLREDCDRGSCNGPCAEGTVKPPWGS